MTSAVPMVEIWRGEFLESVHHGHAVICDEKGDILRAWGNPEEVVLPRSSCKMVQALPLVESGAADAFGLTDEHLALSCASHNGASIHTDRVQIWLADLQLADSDLRCGPQIPDDLESKFALIKTDQSPSCKRHSEMSPVVQSRSVPNGVYRSKAWQPGDLIYRRGDKPCGELLRAIS